MIPHAFADGALDAQSTTWLALTPVTVLRLGPAVAARAAEHPQLSAALSRWLAGTMETAVRLHAVTWPPSTDARVLALFGPFAARWGAPVDDAVRIPLPLRHRDIAEMVGARRPTVTTTLGALARQRALDRDCDRAWLLCA